MNAVVKVDRRIRWHCTTTILRLRIGARLTRYRNCKFHNFARTVRRHADGISRYSVPPSAGPLLPLLECKRSKLEFDAPRTFYCFLPYSLPTLRTAILPRYNCQGAECTRLQESLPGLPAAWGLTAQSAINGNMDWIARKAQLQFARVFMEHIVLGTKQLVSVVC